MNKKNMDQDYSEHNVYTVKRGTVESRLKSDYRLEQTNGGRDCSKGVVRIWRRIICGSNKTGDLPCQTNRI